MSDLSRDPERQVILRQQVDSSHYDFLSYVDHSRFNSFYHQLRLVHELRPRDVLEIGAGSNFLRRALPEKIRYQSMDLDPALKPDIVASLPVVPVADKSFDMVVCFQVLEHLPFELFEECLREFQRVARRYVLISLPAAGYRFQLAINVPRLKWRRLSLVLPHFYRTHRFDGEHFWVIGVKGFSLRRIRTIMTRHMDLVETFRPFEKQEHVFFTLRPRGSEHG